MIPGGESQRERLLAADGLPGLPGSPSSPKCRWQCRDLQTHALLSTGRARRGTRGRHERILGRAVRSSLALHRLEGHTRRPSHALPSVIHHQLHRQQPTSRCT
eukprot:5128384-Prymnesium_polylepis.1